MEWQPIETAPKDGSSVLLYEHPECHLGFYAGDSWWNNLFEPWRCLPTHWMPLPEPPKED